MGLTYAAADAVENGASNVSDAANMATVATGGITAPVTVPLAKVADGVSSGSQIVKGTIHVIDGNYTEAAEMGLDAIVTAGTTSAANRVLKKVKKNANLTKQQSDVHDSAFGLFFDAIKSVLLSPLIKF